MSKSVVTQKLVNQKIAELEGLSNKELIDRICSCENQSVLNVDEETGMKFPRPIGLLAHDIKHQNYQMSEAERREFLFAFADATIPEAKVTNRNAFAHNIQDFAMQRVEQADGPPTYETSFVLCAEPRKLFNPNAVKVLMAKPDGTLQQVGYVERSFANDHPGIKEQTVKGCIIDHSYGQFKNVSYAISLDIEEVDNRYHNRPHFHDTKQEPVETGENYLYSRPVVLNDPWRITDVSAVNEQLPKMQLLTRVQKELDYWERPDIGHIVEVGYTFDTPQSGELYVKTNAPLSEKSLEKLVPWATNMEENGRLATYMESQLNQPYNPFADVCDSVFQSQSEATGLTLQSVTETAVGVSHDLKLTESDLEGLDTVCGEQL